MNPRRLSTRLRRSASSSAWGPGWRGAPWSWRPTARAFSAWWTASSWWTAAGYCATAPSSRFWAGWGKALRRARKPLRGASHEKRTDEPAAEIGRLERRPRPAADPGLCRPGRRAGSLRRRDRRHARRPRHAHHLAVVTGDRRAAGVVLLRRGGGSVHR